MEKPKDTEKAEKKRSGKTSKAKASSSRGGVPKRMVERLKKVLELLTAFLVQFIATVKEKVRDTKLKDLNVAFFKGKLASLVQTVSTLRDSQGLSDAKRKVVTAMKELKFDRRTIGLVVIPLLVVIAVIVTVIHHSEHAIVQPVVLPSASRHEREMVPAGTLLPRPRRPSRFGQAEREEADMATPHLNLDIDDDARKDDDDAEEQDIPVSDAVDYEEEELPFRDPTLPESLPECKTGARFKWQSLLFNWNPNKPVRLVGEVPPRCEDRRSKARDAPEHMVDARRHLLDASAGVSSSLPAGGNPSLLNLGDASTVPGASTPGARKLLQGAPQTPEFMEKNWFRYLHKTPANDINLFSPPKEDRNVAADVVKLLRGQGKSCDHTGVACGGDGANSGMRWCNGVLGRCAVVGNGRSLKLKLHGPDIDAHDTVIRIGHVKVTGFEEHVGRRTSILYSRSRCFYKCTKQHALTDTMDIFFNPGKEDLVSPVRWTSDAVPGEGKLWLVGPEGGAHAGQIVVTTEALSKMRDVDRRIVDRLREFVMPGSLAEREGNRFVPSSGLHVVVTLIQSQLCRTIDLYGFTNDGVDPYWNHHGKFSLPTHGLSHYNVAGLEYFVYELAMANGLLCLHH